MIQRIQSLYLLLAAIFIGGPAIFPFATSAEPKVNSDLFADGVFNITDSLVLIVLFALIGLLTFITIFLFRNRPLQMRLSLISILLAVVALGIGGYLWWIDQTRLSNLQVDVQLGSVLPLLTIVSIYLAYRAIKKDEKKVVDSNRLR